MPKFFMCCPFIGKCDRNAMMLACLMLCDVRVGVGHPERVVETTWVEFSMN